LQSEIEEKDDEISKLKKQLVELRTNISEMQSKMDQEKIKWKEKMDFVNNALTDEKKQKEVTKALEMQVKSLQCEVEEWKKSNLEMEQEKKELAKQLQHTIKQRDSANDSLVVEKKKKLSLSKLAKICKHRSMN